MDLTVKVDGHTIETVYNNDVHPVGQLTDATTFGGQGTLDGRVREFTVTVKDDHEGIKKASNDATITRPDDKSLDLSIVSMDLADLRKGKVIRLSKREKIEGFLAGR